MLLFWMLGILAIVYLGGFLFTKALYQEETWLAMTNMLAIAFIGIILAAEWTFLFLQ